MRGKGSKPIQPVNSCLRTVTGETAPIRGTAELRLGIGVLTIPHQMWVAEITDECILGLDFLERHGCQVDLKEGVLLIGEEEVPLQQAQKDAEPSTCRVIAQDSVNLPPRCETIIPASLLNFNGNARWGVLSPDRKAQSLNGLLIGKTLVDLRERVPVRVLNPSDQPRKLKAGSGLAICVLVESVLTSRVCVGEKVPACELPEHVKLLYERSVTNLQPYQQKLLYNLLQEYAHLFSRGAEDLGRTSIVKHRIDTGAAVPIRQPPRRLPLTRREEAALAVQDMLKQGVIEPSTSPWASPIVLVRKKDGTTRFCVDYRKLNSVTRKDSYPLPRIDDTLESLAGAKWFSTLDLKSGYWQVELDAQDKEKSAFTTGSGLWQFQVMPFGLCNAPATFERLMEQVLVALPLTVCLVYLDDILVPGRTFDEELANLRQVFQRLDEAKLKLSPKKCTLLKQKVTYLGHVVTESGVAMDTDKVAAVQEWPVPRTATEVWSFLGLCSYYRRFVENFAEIARPLHQYSDPRQPFVWTPDAEQAFKQLKKALVKAPILGYPLAKGQLILDTDASNHGIGAVLSQVQEGQECVIAYYSRVLTQPEQNYCVTRRELLAIVSAVKHTPMPPAALPAL